MAQVRSGLMADTVSYVLSGAGNANGSETLRVTDVLSSVVDPSDATVTNYNATIYPFVDISGTNFVVSTCADSVEDDTGASQDACDLMKQIPYTQLLVNSCSSSYAATTSDSDSASTSTSVSSQASSASSSQVSGPSYDSSIYPSGFSGGCSAAYYQTQYGGMDGMQP